MAYKIIRHDRNFSSSSWSIHHISRHRKAARMPNKALNDFNALSDGCPEMRKPFRQVALE